METVVGFVVSYIESGAWHGSRWYGVNMGCEGIVMVSGTSSSFAVCFMRVVLYVTWCPPKLQEQLLEGKRRGQL